MDTAFYFNPDYTEIFRLMIKIWCQPTLCLFLLFIKITELWLTVDNEVVYNSVFNESLTVLLSDKAGLTSYMTSASLRSTTSDVSLNISFQKSSKH